MEIGVWRFLPSRYCGIGRPKRSLSSSINKGEPIFIWCWILNWRFTCKYFHTRVSVGNTAVLISKIDIFAASLMAAVLGDRYSSCSNYNFLCSSSDGSCSRAHLPRYYSLLAYKLNADRLLLLLLTRKGDTLLEGLSNLSSPNFYTI
jgi:hypothetical protein